MQNTELNVKKLVKEIVNFINSQTDYDAYEEYPLDFYTDIEQTGYLYFEPDELALIKKNIALFEHVDPETHLFDYLVDEDYEPVTVDTLCDFIDNNWPEGYELDVVKHYIAFNTGKSTDLPEFDLDANANWASVDAVNKYYGMLFDSSLIYAGRLQTFNDGKTQNTAVSINNNNVQILSNRDIISVINTADLNDKQKFLMQWTFKCADNIVLG